MSVTFLNSQQPQQTSAGLKRAYLPSQQANCALEGQELLRHNINFLKTFFSSERSIDEAVIEATMTECGNDRAKAFESLMHKISSCAQQQVHNSASKPKKRRRSDFENEHMASASSTPSRDKAHV